MNWQTNLPLCFKSVGVQAVNVIEDHVVIERYIGTVDAKGNIMRSDERHVWFIQSFTLCKQNVQTHLDAILKTSVAQAAG